MDETTYRRWWPLHIRTAKGEILNAEEQAVYEAGRQRMYAKETINGGLAGIRQARERMLELKAEYHRMRRRYEQLAAELVTLEAQLDAPTKELLGVGD
jgi:hypothetical protein